MSGADVVGALDIGGTHVSGGRVQVSVAALETRSRVAEPLPAAAGRDELLAAIARVAGSISRPGMSPLGVAVPGPFDYAAGVSEITHKLEALHGVDLRSQLRAAIPSLEPAAIRFLNDAEAFLLGEWWAGAARGHVRAVGVTLGTGLGSAFCEDGEIVRWGGRVPPRGELYRLRLRGAPVEQTISRAALVAGFGARLEDGIDVEQIADLADSGVLDARRVFTELGTALGQLLSPWLRRFAPSVVVVGGSIARSFALFEDSLRTELETAPGLRLVTAAEQLDDAALLGAAYYAMKSA